MSFWEDKTGCIWPQTLPHTRHPHEGILWEPLTRAVNVEGLPHEEIARRMDRGVGAVRMHWVRALARLRDEQEASTDGAP